MPKPAYLFLMMKGLKFPKEKSWSSFQELKTLLDYGFCALLKGAADSQLSEDDPAPLRIAFALSLIFQFLFQTSQHLLLAPAVPSYSTARGFLTPLI